jgi:two-component system, cell cycle sensor histidine kinase and response regulator CckA
MCETRQLVIDSAMLAVSDTSVACLFDIEKDVWPLKADKIQIGQVVTNLVVNAVDAMEKSGIIELQARNRDLRNASPRKRPLGADSQPIEAGLYVEIRVTDQGPGIPDSIRAKIFDPFFTTKEKGTGLGLSIVYSVIQNHRGAISVVSRLGEGTTFSFFIPAFTESQQSNVTPDLAILEKKKKVLVMDDEPMVIETAKGILASLGYDIVETSNGSEAVAAYRSAMQSGVPFDFCILDLIIPGGMGGSDCAREILAMDSSAVLLVSSGYSNDPVLAHAKDYGFRGIIPKPYTVEEFRQVLFNVLVF